jgi:SecD/SecF fusion protein
MNRSHFWKFLIIVFIVAWALFEMYPPTGRNVLEVFQERALNKDATFSNIVSRAEALQKKMPERTYGNLKEAVGTNAIAAYFPFISVQGEKDPDGFILTRIQREASGKIRLGLDLQGGTSFLVRMDTNNLQRAEQKEAALSQAVEVLRKRVDKMGVAEPIIQPAGSDLILIQLPGLSEADKERARKNIETAAFLEFRMVHPDSDKLLREDIVPPGYEILREQRKLPDGTKQVIPYLVKKAPERGLTGKYVKRAMMTRNPMTNKPEIHFDLDSKGAELFAAITREFQPQGDKKFQLAIVLDGDLYSAPQINGPIEGGSGVITGNFDAREAYELANVLENPLEAPVKIIEERSVDPSLGKDSIASGLRAAIYGTVAVVGFMIVYYFLAGCIADLAVLLNLIILMGVMCALPATLTLPGIAGIVLTVGMAVDANVLIFERIREEFSAGKSVRGALNAGYNKAFGTILDSNVTTLISSVILIFMGSGPVKGFGVTLTIGILSSMFTALVVTRLIFDFLLAKNILKSIPMLSFFGRTKIDFLRLAKPAFALSWIVIVAGMSYGLFVRGHEVMGVDFAGGDSLRMDFKQRVDVDQIRNALKDFQIGSPQYQKDLATGKENLLLTSAFDTGSKVADQLIKSFPNAGITVLSTDKVGPTVGADILSGAIVATLLAMFGILIYVAFRFELSFAVGAVLAIVHDVFMTFGVFFFWGGVMNAPMVAAILTIIGFSINDTIVIFDRIREDLKMGVRGSFKDIMNTAINQTLSRTIITSGTTLLSALALFIFGGGVINEFAFTFLVGVVTGTYSSIYIASAIVLWWHKGERPRTSSQVTMDTSVVARV